MKSEDYLLPTFVVVGFLVVCVVAIHYQRPSLDRAQAGFEQQEKRWNWEGWHADGSLVCKDRRDGELRSCRVFIPVRNGIFGEPRQQLAAFACSPYACDWLLDPSLEEP